MSRHQQLLVGMILFAGVLLSGCSEPKIARHNLRLTMALRTAISARNADWLQACREQMEAKRSAAEMSDEEYARFQTIFAQADAEAWDAAERDVVAWQKGQRE